MAVLGLRGSFRDSAHVLHPASVELGNAYGGAVSADGLFAVSGADDVYAGADVVAVRGRPTLGGARVDAMRLLDLARGRRSEFLADLKGVFALVIYEANARRVTLAVDRMGVERLTYATSSTGLWFGTKATDARGAPGVDAAISNQSVFDYLFFHMVPSPATIFRGVSKVPPSHVVEWHKGRTSSKRYWSPDFATEHPGTSADLERDLCDALEGSVARAMDPKRRTGAFLSGGLDSSTVAGYFAKRSSSSVDVFSIGFDVAEFDELAYARIAAGHFGCKLHEYKVSPSDIVSAFDRVVEAYDEPFGNSSVIPTYFCAKFAAESGIELLLAGDGGDELFAGNERYAKHTLLERYGRIPAVVRRALVEPSLRMLAPLEALTPVRKARRYVEQARVPLPQRLGANFAFNADMKNAFSEDFVAAVNCDRPLQHMIDVYQSSGAPTMLDHLLVYDWRFTLADNDLRKVETMCQLAGIGVAYPMLDDDLVELSLKIPAAMKMEGTQLRSFYKRALRDFLPQQVLTKRKHGFGLPFGVWLKTDSRLRELIFGMLEDLKARRIFRPAFIDDVVTGHRDGPASYFGYFIWDLAVLERWLKSYG